MKKSLLLFVAIAQMGLLFAQKAAPENWFNLDPKLDKVRGVSTERTYNELLKGKTSKTVVVAVIDGGTEVMHEDLKSVIWVNPNEIPGNNIDDDHNGYVDDINGWNFIGGADGKNVAEDNLELTRLYREYNAKYGKADTTQLDGVEMENYRYYVKLKTKFETSYKRYSNLSTLYTNFSKGLTKMKKDLGKDEVTLQEVRDYSTTDPNASKVRESLLSNNKIFSKGKVNITTTIKELDGIVEQLSKFVYYHYNVDFDSRTVVGDNYTNTTERYYGNNLVSGPNGDHGSHVAGIIAAVRTNNIGIKGVADNVKIMVLRVVPDGDERDKDVANAIRYAVDNGATVINMSFGKPYSPYKSAVDEAVRYALSKDVLLVHAAGNDSKNTDVEDNFPNDKIANYNQVNWIEVGASSWYPKKKLIPAEFSNYAMENVDVFAPGVDINSCIPESKYASFDGTSMAAPVTAGVAAVLRSYYPQLTAGQVKEIIMKSAVPVKGKVVIPGTKKKAKMSVLCKSGGLVNLYEAVKLAETYVTKH
jgi:subtilisin family serine protease